MAPFRSAPASHRSTIIFRKKLVQESYSLIGTGKPLIVVEAHIFSRHPVVANPELIAVLGSPVHTESPLRTLVAVGSHVEDSWRENRHPTSRYIPVEPNPREPR